MKKLLGMKKAAAVLMALLLLFSAAPVTAFAADTELEYFTAMEEPALFDSVKSSSETLEAAVDLEALRSYLFEQFANCPGSVNISEFNIPNTADNAEALRSFIWYEMPESFHVYALGIAGSSVMTRISVTYKYSSEEYKSMYAKCEASAEKLLKGIKNNNNLSDVEKALLLHDRLAVLCEYDYNSTADQHNMYGVFVNQTAVCQGYAMAYAYLLNQVGIDNHYCRSSALNHAWNIVYINNKPYHVDVTWDDKTWDVTGRVDHENFLRSSKGIYDTGHEAEDYDTSPTDTTYDSYFWQNSATEFQLIGDEIYYIDNTNAVLKRLNGTTGEKLYSVSDKWKAGSNSTWSGNFARLSSDGRSLYYSLSNGIYRYNFNTKAAKLIYEPDLTVGEYFSIYGFAYDDGYLICELNNSPLFDSATKKRYQVRQLYDIISPRGTIIVSNNVSPSQTVTITLSDNAGVVGYYWGTSSTYSDNTYVKTSGTTLKKTIADPGTYYLTVKDIAGNVSVTKSITFYRTTLNANGGRLTPGKILTAEGKSFTFPTPERSGYNYKGWSLSSSAVDGIKSLTPNKDATYYAVWEKIPAALVSIAVDKEPAKTEYYIGEEVNTEGLRLKLTYSDNSEEYIASGYSISGFDSKTAGKKEVTVHYEGKTTVFYVTVAETEKPSDNNVVMRFDASKAYVNGSVLPTTQYVSGYATLTNLNGTAMMPLRYIAEVNGFSVAYDDATQKTKVTNKANGDYLMITPGSAVVEKYDISGSLVGTSNAPHAFSIENGVTMGPLRFTCEALGLCVYYQWIADGEEYVTVATSSITVEQSDALIEKARGLGL